MKSPDQKVSSNTTRVHSKDGNAFFAKGREERFGPEKKTDPFFLQKKEPPAPFFSGSSFIQPKLDVHPADDTYEKEADAVADRVVKQVTAPPPVQRKETEEENIQALSISNGISSLQTHRAFESPTALEQSSAQTEDIFGLQTKAGEAVSAPGRGLESQLQSTRGSGSQLPESTRSKMESGFGADFSGVHVHTDNNAAQMNKQLGARAFTHGSDIYFNQGEYQPATSTGDHLLAHELTHTMQQGAAKAGGVQRKQMVTPEAKQGSHVHPDSLREKGTIGTEKPVQIKGRGKAPVTGCSITPIDNRGNQFPLRGAVNSVINGVIQRKSVIDDVIADKFEDNKLGKIDTSSKQINIPELKVPDFKEKLTKAIELPKPNVKRTNKQRDIWDKEVGGSITESLLSAKFAALNSPKLTNTGGQKIYALKLKKKSGSFVIGGLEDIKKRLGRPQWDKTGKEESYQVDHMHEFQLGGPDEAISNLWLLEAQANMSSGRNIKTEKDKTIKALLGAASKPGEKQVWKEEPGLTSVREAYTVKFGKAIPGLPLSPPGKPDHNYNRTDIEKGDSLEGLAALTSDEIDKLGFFRDDIFNLFTHKDGGRMNKIEKWNSQETKKSIYLKLGTNIDISEISFNKESGSGQVKGNLFKGSPHPGKYLTGSDYAFDIKAMPGFPNAAYIDNPSMSKELKEKIKAKAFSPIEFSETDLEPGKGLVLRGKILPSIPIIEKAGIELVLSGNDVYLEKVFSTLEFQVPAPFKISDSSLTVRAGTVGLEFEGSVDFGIEKVGEGSITAYVNSKQEFGVKGSFEFDKKLFDNAKVEVTYENRQWAVKGTIEIPKGRVKGIKKASATIAYSEGNLSASGTVVPEIKGINQGSFELKYSQEKFMMSGQLQLSPEIPKLKKGEISVTLESKPDSGYKLKGNGIAEFDFPGINSGLKVEYDDGLLTIEATVNFEKGIAKGEVKAGATNRPVDAQGNPVGEPGGKWIIYGGGTLTVKITPWLQVAAGVHFLPNGELEVLGKIELPSTVDVFSQKSFEKTLFSMPTIEIPLFAIPLGPKSLGLVAQIRGGLDFKASLGPGQLRGLFGQIKFNPSHPEETTLSGGGSFVIPAEAGLYLHASLGLGLSVAIASLTGGLELAAGVGLKGEASAGINLSWNPTSGLELNAEGKVTVHPKFKFDVNLFARASLDLFLFEISKEWRYNLASYEWGPGFEFGLIFPIHYKEGQPFNISFDDIQVIKPEVDIMGTVKGIGKKVKDEVF